MVVVGEVIADLLMLAGAFLVLSSGLAFFKERDALTRLSALGPATAFGMPFLTLGAMLGWLTQEGFSWMVLLKSAVAMVSFVLVSAVGTNVLARATYMSGALLDPETDPNDLRDDPADRE